MQLEVPRGFEVFEATAASFERALVHDLVGLVGRSTTTPSAKTSTSTPSLVRPGRGGSGAGDAAEWRPGATAAARVVLHGLRRLAVRSLEPEAFVFHRGGRPLSSMEVHRAWKRVLLAAQVRHRMPEQLRHTFASTMLSRNAPLL